MSLFVTLKSSSLSKFLSLGVLNTVFTTIIYQFLLFFIDSEIAYSISWFIGFLFLVVAYPKYVFGSRTNFVSVVFVSLVYLSSLVLGYYSMIFFDGVGMNSRISIFFIIALTSIYNFICMNAFFKRRA